MNKCYQGIELGKEYLSIKYNKYLYLIHSPLLFLALTSAPCCTRYCTTRRCPLSAAQWRGVLSED